MKKVLKKLLSYRIEGIESVISIGRKNIRFMRKTVLFDTLIRLNENIRELELEYQALDLKLKDKNAKNSLLENQLSLQISEIDQYKQQIEVSQNMNAYLKKELEQEKKDYLELQASANSNNHYVGSFWCTGWIEYWKKYFIENIQIIEEKIKAAKAGVDEESVKVIDLFLERNFHMMPVQKYADFFLYDRNKIFNDWELNGMGEDGKEDDIRHKYQLDSEVYLETPVFKFHCGLTLLPYEIQKQIKEKDIIDGGAFWGDSALILQEYTPKSIHAFEPMPVNFEKLCEIKERNHLDLLYPVQAGLGDREVEKTLYYHEMLSGASVINYKAIMNERPETHSDNINIVTIDSYTLAHDLNVGLIKLDIEGSELEAIKGAVETICKYKPILLISVYHLPKDFFEIKPFLESLNLGYQFMFRKLVYHDPLTEVSLIGFIPQN